MKAIETVYKGYKFRSRLEARWAVFFDTLGIEYQYEPEGFDLDGIWYLPDFYMPRSDIYVEIKPSSVSREGWKKCVAFAKNGGTIALIEGEPFFDKYEIYIFLEGYFDLVCCCRESAEVFLSSLNDLGFVKKFLSLQTMESYEVLYNSYLKARQARFGRNGTF